MDDLRAVIEAAGFHRPAVPAPDEWRLFAIDSPPA